MLRSAWILAVGFVAADVACGAPAWSSLSAEVRDLEARIEYGYYAEEARTVEGALERLRQLADSDPAALYFEGLASYRLAQLAPDSDRAAGARHISDCLEATRALEEESGADAEAAILAAACGTLAVTQATAGAPVSQRRLEQSLARARGLDADNPRLALVEARWLVARESPPAEERTRLEAAVAAFETRGGEGEPSWGEAEALALLAEIDLEDGRARAARDMIERALLAAPGYRFALSLEERL